MTTRANTFAPIASICAALALLAALPACGSDAPQAAPVAPSRPAVVVSSTTPPPQPAAAPASHAATPAPRAQDAPEPSRARPLEVVQATAARGVSDRTPVGADNAFSVRSGVVYAHVTLRNMEEPTEVQMVWKRDGEVSSSVTLPVGTSPRWRTWSQKRLRAWDAGAWTVEILDAQGDLLHTLRFDVHEAPAGHDDEGEEGC